MNLANVATKKWNADYTVYGAMTAALAITGTPGVTAAAIDMPSSYMAFDSTLRIAYVALAGTAGGLYPQHDQSFHHCDEQRGRQCAPVTNWSLVRPTSNTVYRLAAPSTALNTAVLGKLKVAWSWIRAPVGPRLNSSAPTLAQRLYRRWRGEPLTRPLSVSPAMMASPSTMLPSSTPRSTVKDLSVKSDGSKTIPRHRKSATAYQRVAQDHRLGKSLQVRRHWATSYAPPWTTSTSSTWRRPPLPASGTAMMPARPLRNPGSPTRTSPTWKPRVSA